MVTWSVDEAYQIFKAGESFFKYYRHFRESIYKDKQTLALVE